MSRLCLERWSHQFQPLSASQRKAPHWLSKGTDRSILESSRESTPFWNSCTYIPFPSSFPSVLRNLAAESENRKVGDLSIHLLIYWLTCLLVSKCLQQPRLGQIEVGNQKLNLSLPHGDLSPKDLNFLGWTWTGNQNRKQSQDSETGFNSVWDVRISNGGFNTCAKHVHPTLNVRCYSILVDSALNLNFTAMENIFLLGRILLFGVEMCFIFTTISCWPHALLLT